MHYEIPIADFEEMIGQGLWVGHRFICNGQNLVLTAISQAQTTDDGQRVVPVEIEQEGLLLSMMLPDGSTVETRVCDS